MQILTVRFSLGWCSWHSMGTWMEMSAPSTPPCSTSHIDSGTGAAGYVVILEQKKNASNEQNKALQVHAGTVCLDNQANASTKHSVCFNDSHAHMHTMHPECAVIDCWLWKTLPFLPFFLPLPSFSLCVKPLLSDIWWVAFYCGSANTFTEQEPSGPVLCHCGQRRLLSCFFFLILPLTFQLTVVKGKCGSF